MNKKAMSVGDMTSMVVLFILFVLVAGGIAFSFSLSFEEDYDFREIDAKLLSERLADCVSSNVLDDSFKNNIYSLCSLDKESFGEFRQFKICIDSLNCLVDNTAFILEGSNFEICELNLAEKNQEQFICFPSEFNLNGKKIQIITKSSVRRTIQ
jgi:hypothetical protein